MSGGCILFLLFLGGSKCCGDVSGGCIVYILLFLCDSKCWGDVSSRVV